MRSRIQERTRLGKDKLTVKKELQRLGHWDLPWRDRHSGLRHVTGADIYTVNHKKGGSTFVIVTPENLDGF